MNKRILIPLLAVLTAGCLAGCGKEAATLSAEPTPGVTGTAPSQTVPDAGPNAAGSTPAASPQKPDATAKSDSDGKSSADKDSDTVQVVAAPESITVLVNKQWSLPSSYEPKDLVYPNVPFVFKDQIEKRKMRKPAADALEKLFAAAKKDGAALAGVSAYRSYATQKALFERYVKQDGLEKARMYSALPGTSEHETGLAIDVTGSDGKCAAESCFGGTKEAKWLAQHAPEYGFIIRYPQGKESITGYQYEPWHLRYVGTDVAKEIAKKNITLEEYLNAVPVAKPK